VFERPVSLVNGRIVTGDGICATLRFDARVRAVDERPRPGDIVVDLDGAFVLPGLVNAHDHLELNHYGRLKVRDRYADASEWIDDLRPLLDGDPFVRERRRHPLRERLFIGALKNLLAGVTTVAHHNPLYRELGRSYPIRVVTRFGWAHSFALEGAPVGARGEPGGEVARCAAATPASAPFILHLAEGTDARAAGELAKLDALGGIRANTVLVHGVALGPRDWQALVARGAGLVWCPASNLFLFGRTAPVRAFLDAVDGSWRHLALGTDSRVTGSRDLLDELRAAASAAPVTPAELLRMVTVAPAAMLRLTHAGRIAVGAPADLLIVPGTSSEPGEALLALDRAAVGLVVVGGRPVVGDPSLRAVFNARRVAVQPVRVDGAIRLADAALARQLEACPIEEAGVDARPRLAASAS
jgi:cytosine/adenosine deaminase-related metal-dependent hydrolase